MGLTCLTCVQLTSPSPLWLNRPVFLPHWNYIPHDALRQDGERGHVELIGSPVLLCHGAVQGLAASAGEGAGLAAVVSVSQAAGFLRNRWITGPLTYGSTTELCVNSVLPLCVSGSKVSVCLCTVRWGQCALCWWWQELPSSSSL